MIWTIGNGVEMYGEEQRRNGRGRLELKEWDEEEEEERGSDRIGNGNWTTEEETEVEKKKGEFKGLL